MPYDSSRQSEYLISRWAESLVPSFSPSILQRQLSGFGRRTIRSPVPSFLPFPLPSSRSMRFQDLPSFLETPSVVPATSSSGIGATSSGGTGTYGTTAGLTTTASDGTTTGDGATTGDTTTPGDGPTTSSSTPPATTSSPPTVTVSSSFPSDSFTTGGGGTAGSGETTLASGSSGVLVIIPTSDEGPPPASPPVTSSVSSGVTVCGPLSQRLRCTRSDSGLYTNWYVSGHCVDYAFPYPTKEDLLFEISLWNSSSDPAVHYPRSVPDGNLCSYFSYNERISCCSGGDLWHPFKCGIWRWYACFDDGGIFDITHLYAWWYILMGESYSEALGTLFQERTIANGFGPPDYDRACCAYPYCEQPSEC